MDIKIQREDIFPTELFYTYLDESLVKEIQYLADREEENWKKDLDNVKAKTSGWNGLRYEIIRNISSFASDKVLPEISKNLNTHYSNWSCWEAWINYYQQDDKSLPHAHFFVDYCAVLIVKAGDGNLNFIEPKYTLGATREWEDHQIHKINERNGKFIFFPAWMHHYVEACKEKRITVAFNFMNNKTNDRKIRN